MINTPFQEHPTLNDACDTSPKLITWFKEPFFVISSKNDRRVYLGAWLSQDSLYLYWKSQGKSKSLRSSKIPIYRPLDSKDQDSYYLRPSLFKVVRYVLKNVDIITAHPYFKDFIYRKGVNESLAMERLQKEIYSGRDLGEIHLAMFEYAKSQKIDTNYFFWADDIDWGQVNLF